MDRLKEIETLPNDSRVSSMHASLADRLSTCTFGLVN